MGKRVWIITVAIALVAGLAQASVPVAAGDLEIVRLGRVTTFAAGETASMLVRLPEAVPLNGELRARARFEGNGRIIAFILVMEGWEGRPTRRPMLVGQRVGQCYEAACTPQTLIGGGVWGRGVRTPGGGPYDWQVPAGVYRAYVVTDGAPVEMKLLLPGLSGRATLTPTEPEEAQIETLTPQVHEMVGLNVYSTGAVAPYPGEGYSSIAAWRKGDVKVAGAYGLCTYDEEPPPADTPVAYLPVVCPREIFRHSNVYPTPLRNYAGGLEAVVDHVPAALGVWWADAALARDYGATALWVRM